MCVRMHKATRHNLADRSPSRSLSLGTRTTTTLVASSGVARTTSAPILLFGGLHAAPRRTSLANSSEGVLVHSPSIQNLSLAGLTLDCTLSDVTPRNTITPYELEQRRLNPSQYSVQSVLSAGDRQFGIKQSLWTHEREHNVIVTPQKQYAREMLFNGLLHLIRGVFSRFMAPVVGTWLQANDATQHLSPHEKLFNVFKTIIEAPFDLEIHHDHMRLFGSRHTAYKVKWFTIPMELIHCDSELSGVFKQVVAVVRAGFQSEWDGVSSLDATSYVAYCHNERLEATIGAMRLELAATYAVAFQSIFRELNDTYFLDAKLLLLAAAQAYEHSVLMRHRNASNEVTTDARGNGLTVEERGSHERAMRCSSALTLFVRGLEREVFNYI